jgi:nitrogen fixation/metabolism regulation signal transduction histidine kinase
MQYIVRHVSVGLIAFDLKGNVEIINKAAMELLGVGEINSIMLLEKVKPELPGILNNMKAEEQKVMNLKSNNRIMQLAIRVTIFKIGEKEIRLVSFQDIKNELDEKEMDSWQKLIRVLTHEIINSVTPVTSLTSTISGFFKRGDDIVSSKDLSDETIREALTGLGYIEERGKNLIDFVIKFRSLTKLPVPRFEETKVTDLLNEINLLKKEELFAKGINFSSSVVSDGLTVFCDRGLIGHVLLNLVNNAVDAVESNTEAKGKSIEITGSKGEEQRIQIVIADNGTGIPEELVEDIFIPFFTTKENGSGIGLSLCRQIMKLHGGTITVNPVFGIETRFTMKF